MAYIDQKIIPLLLPLQKTKHGIIGILAGHHWTQLSPVLNSVQYICNEITRLSGKKVAYLGEMLSYLEISFVNDKKSIKKNILVVHGEGGGQTKASTIQKMERLAQGFDNDGIIRAHDTQLVATKTDKLYPKERRKKSTPPEMLSRTIPYLNLGAATKSYDMDLNDPSYAERALFRPNTLGWGTLKFILRRAYQWEDKDHNLRCVTRVEI